MLTDNWIEKIKSPAFKASGLLSYSFVLDEAIKHPDLQSDKALIEKLELLKAEINKDAITNSVYNIYSETRMRLLGYCLNNKMKIFKEHKTAYISVNKDEIEK
jgi:hypothetical protein